MSEKALRLDPDDAWAYFLKEPALNALGKEEAKAVHQQSFTLLISALRAYIDESNARYESKQRKRKRTQ